jgi:phosphoglycerate dehydrogenase-like enzyme
MARPQLLLVCDQWAREKRVDPAELERLQHFADWEWLPCEKGMNFEAGEDGQAAALLGEKIGTIDGLLVCRGAPRIDAQLLDRATKLKIIGELEGDRFAERIDVEAAWERGIRTVDTTNGSSYPVAEWALGLILISLRNAGARFRQLIAGEVEAARESRLQMRGMLTGKRVGLIGCGHIGRRLVQFLRPFETDIWVYDPYLPSEMADAVGVMPTSLDNLLSQCDAIVCLAPLTPKTRGMIGQRELELVRPGTVLVNVSRGAIIDSVALLARLKRGDITAGLDVFDPEPFPADSEILHLPNVFLSPHFAGLTGDDYPHFTRLMVDELDRFFHGHGTLYDLTPRSLANRRGNEPA